MNALGTIELVLTRIGQPKIISVNRHGQPVWSSIDRQPVSDGISELYLTWIGLSGDLPTETRAKTPREASGSGPGQIHGGHDKALYAYPIEHYAHWFSELGADGLRGRSLGENWCVQGVTEADVCIGDRWEVGEASVEVSKVRTPCQTLVTYYGGQRMVKRMTHNGLCGWYLRVLRPGLVPVRGTIRVVRGGTGPTIAEAFAAKMHSPAGG